MPARGRSNYKSWNSNKFVKCTNVGIGSRYKVRLERGRCGYECGARETGVEINN
jgi:hypothetical protein